MATHEHSPGKFGRALVIGGSIGGLVAARVLADFFDHVTIVEREIPPRGPTPRKCVPQGAHAHVLLDLGAGHLRRWFPDLVDEMVQAGAYVFDPLADAVMHHYGGWKPRGRSDMETLSCTRPFLEWHIRKYVEALPNVEFLYEHTVETLLWDTPKEHVAGVHIKGPSGERNLYANWVVDAGGRGTRLPRWLAENGYERPHEEAVDIHLAYTSVILTMPVDYDPGCKLLAVYGRVPHRRGAFLYEVENKRWAVSLTGYLGDHAPTDEDGFRAFAKSLPVPHVEDALLRGTFHSPITQHKIPSSRWNRYDKLRRFPDGIVAIADSIASLNPLYGQGMSIAIREAAELETSLAGLRERGESLRGVSNHLQKKLAGVVEIPWLMATTLDLRYAEARGRRPFGSKTLQWMFQNVCDVTSIEPKASRIFMEVLQMRRGLEGLVHPDLVLPLLGYTAKSPFTPIASLLKNGPMPPRP